MPLVARTTNCVAYEFVTRIVQQQQYKNTVAYSVQSSLLIRSCYVKTEYSQLLEASNKLSFSHNYT